MGKGMKQEDMNLMGCANFKERDWNMFPYRRKKAQCKISVGDKLREALILREILEGETVF